MIASGSAVVFVVGKVAEDEDGTVVGRDDFSTQARQVFSNLGRALSAAGVEAEQVVRLGIFVVGLGEEASPGDRGGTSGTVR